LGASTSTLRDRRLVDRRHREPGRFGAGRRQAWDERKKRGRDGARTDVMHGFLP
jgi:hypothetical protein